MPQIHSLGPLFVQVLDLPVQWESKVIVRGWTQEIEPPYRTGYPLLVRLPKHKALALGVWSHHQTDEEAALKAAMEVRDVTYDDFTQEAGWTDPDTYREESSEPVHAGLDWLDRNLNVRDREASEPVVEDTEPDRP